MKYTQNLKSENLEFRIPDYTSSKTRSSCSFTSSFNEYTGTKEYQKDLQVYVGLSLAYSGVSFDGAFSASAEYKEMKKTTSESSTVVLESSADCELMSLEMPSFDMLDLNSDFSTACLEALKGGKTEWLNLFDKFGTHFVTSTVLGGRMHLRQEMKSENYQELVTMGVNIRAAAEFSYQSLSGKVDSQFNKNTNQTNAFNSRVEKKKVIYLGGEPPKNQTWEEWFDSVQVNPVPINYKINPIEELFTKKNFNLNQTELTSMRSKFQEALLNFFRSVGDTNVTRTTDPPLPTSLKNNLEKTPGYGMNGRNDFDDMPFLLQKLKPTFRPYKVMIRYSNQYINSLQFQLSDSVNYVFTPMRGSLQNTESTFSLDEEDDISQIEIWSDESWIYGMRFITNKGKVSNNGKIFGGSSGTYNMITLKGRLVGSFGQIKEGYFKSIGFIENIVDNKILKGRDCSPPWQYYNEKCYSIEVVDSTYDEASKKCQQLGGNLVNINSEAELNFVDSIIDYDKKYHVNLSSYY